MVSPELEREYERRGIGLIEPDEGVDQLPRRAAPAARRRPGDPHERASPDRAACERSRRRRHRRDGVRSSRARPISRPSGGTSARASTPSRDVPPGRWDPVFYDPESSVARPLLRPARRLRRRARDASTPSRFGDHAGRGRRAPSRISCSRSQVAARALADAGYSTTAVRARARRASSSAAGNYLGAGRDAARAARPRRRAARRAPARARARRRPRPSSPRVKARLPARARPAYGADTAIGLVPNLAASRIANRLDLGGPAYTVDAACASALVAVDQACRRAGAPAAATWSSPAASTSATT